MGEEGRRRVLVQQEHNATTIKTLRRKRQYGDLMRQNERHYCHSGSSSK
jgi:hypothetical protein